MENSFKKHLLSKSEKLWLQESTISNFNPKVAKVKLVDSLSVDFDPKKIDQRLYVNGQLTFIGLWHVNSEHPIFHQTDLVISAIRKRIFENPGIEYIKAEDIADITKLDEDTVAHIFKNLNQLGSFFSSASGPNENKYTTISLTSENAYDEYLWYTGIEDLLEKNYIKREPSMSFKLDNSFFKKGLFEFNYEPEQFIERKSIKPNTAFILMAINPQKPDLMDVYNAIKRVCKNFDINAYRADEIEHQDRITDIVLKEIRTCEFLIADLSYERPNVYYEIGYAHAINKKPILYRRSGTSLHFDLSVHNVPEYENVTELEDLLRKRLEAILGRKAKSLN